MQAFRLDGQIAIVTGAGTGIGQRTAVTLAEAGARAVLITGRRADKLAETAELIKKTAPDCRVISVKADLTTNQGRDDVIGAAKNLGQLDSLVNNAGIFVAKALRETTEQDWQEHLDINAYSPLALTRDLLPWLAKSRNAAVVNISSTLAEKPIANTSAYNASKAALIQLTRSLALELGPDQIRVNCVLPAIVETPMYAGRYTSAAEYQAALAGAVRLHPLGRVGQPQDVAWAVLYLLSPAASWVTGVALPVDGGMLVT